MNQLSDENLVSGLKSSVKAEKDSALKQIYAQHYPVILAFITKNNGSEEDAADIFQDAIVVFYEKIRLGQLEMSSTIRTYLYSVCKHLWLNRLRAQKKTTNINEETMSIAIAPESLSVIANNERNDLIIQLMEKLGEDCKKVLTHYYFERLKMREIAVRMGFANEQVAKNKKSGCMKKLKSMVLDSPMLKNMLK